MKVLSSKEMLEKLEEFYPIILKTSTVIKNNTNKNNFRFAFDSDGNLFYMTNKIKKFKHCGVGDISAYKFELINNRYYEIKIGNLRYQYDKTLAIESKLLFIRDNFVNNDYQNKSVGSYWLKFFEEIAHHLSLTLLGGNFCPHNGITEENLKKYYEKNGFNVYVDENNDKKIIKKINEETICKIKENSLNYRDFIIYESIVKFGKQQDLAQEI